MSKKEKIKQLIEGQKTFIQEINNHGYEEKDYWLEQGEYRRIQQTLAKEIHNEAHREYLGEYQSKSVIADITAPGGWLEEDE
jgi:hypothetical protein